ncbi:glycoside hydrolase family 16 protein [Gimibacter soli]|uniref:Glycoside hydrolase family 16 protein n=1 Tax=Gimibacter soli TaxID=3024400 RepID=A0AAF0BIE7_9PROT|nr:glycoside hydrolase family 16 protein [Gimibacter soli]WCL55318.1 glycoside hydrolase family 16 protein [Gimibacter soli]
MNRTALCLATLLASSPVMADDSWQLVWADEFDGAALNTGDWRIIEGNGCPQNCYFGNNELQTYTKASENLRIENGVLVIEAKGAGKDFTSAKITTQNREGWTYGRFTMRAKLPKGRGTWPAFWMMPDKASYGPWPKSGEIDLMEHVGYDEGRVHGTIHTEAYNHRIGTQKGGNMVVEYATEDFHEYSAEWTETDIRWYIDGREYYSVTKADSDGHPEWPLDHPFHLILNLAVGGDWGGSQGVDDTAFPVRYEIDWVRVWQKKD